MFKHMVAILSVAFFPLAMAGSASACTQAADAPVAAEQKNPFVTYDYDTGEPVEPDDGFSSDAQ